MDFVVRGPVVARFRRAHKKTNVNFDSCIGILECRSGVFSWSLRFALSAVFLVRRRGGLG